MNEKRELQRSESFAAAALLALSGGLLDAYTYLCRGGVFANAQTGNMVLLAIRAAEGKWQEAGRYLIPILAFAAGVMVAETVKRLHRSNGEIWLLPENPDYEPIDGSEAAILGRVTAVVRQY